MEFECKFGFEANWFCKGFEVEQSIRSFMGVEDLDGEFKEKEIRFQDRFRVIGHPGKSVLWKFYFKNYFQIMTRLWLRK